MKPSLRQVVADSHIAAVAVALLLLWSVMDACLALQDPVARAFHFLATAVAILGIPYFSPGFSTADLVFSGSYLYLSVVCLAAAWLVSRWAYGMGPVRALGEARRKLTGRKDA